MGVRGPLCHDIFCPVPFPASPSDLHRCEDCREQCREEGECQEECWKQSRCLCCKGEQHCFQRSSRHSPSLRGPAAILFISRDTCSDSIAKLFRACFCGGIAQLSRDTLQNGVSHRCACLKLSAKGGYCIISGECQPPFKSIARYGVSQR